MASTGRRRRYGMGCMSLLAIPFALVGFFATYWTTKTLVTHTAMRSWIETPATITHAQLKRNRGDDSDTFQVIAKYQYEHQGRRFTGERVSIYGGSDNIGNFQREAFNEL